MTRIPTYPVHRAIDKALLKLSKEHGFSVPEDDPILAQLFLNKEIISETFSSSIEKLEKENEKSKLFFRETLIALLKTHNEKLRDYRKYLFISVACAAFSATLAFIMVLKAWIS